MAVATFPIAGRNIHGAEDSGVIADDYLMMGAKGIS